MFHNLIDFYNFIPANSSYVAMKKIFLLTILIPSILFTGCQSTAVNEFVDGSYTGVGNGYSGPITVGMTVSSHKITELNVLESFEEAEQARPIFEQLISDVLQKQDVNAVDAISGATITSNGFLDAAYDAQSQAWSGSYVPQQGPRFKKKPGTVEVDGFTGSTPMSSGLNR